MTQLNSWAGIIRWQAGETESEPFQIGDGLHFSFFFPAVALPAGGFTFNGAINREGDFLAPINTEAGAAVALAPVVDEWTSLEISRREIAPFYHLVLVSGVASAGLYEARYVAKRP